jgi:hypothetical protein
MDRGPDILDDIHRRFGEPSKSRLRNLVDFAQVYRGWTCREAAAFLHRDVLNVVPGSGVPKADLILRLARALDSPAPVVLDEICGDASADHETSNPDPAAFAQLNREAFKEFEEGRFEELVVLARRMRAVASTPEERATACLREYGGWDGRGRYEHAMAAVQRGLAEVDLSSELRLSMLANLSSVHHALGRLPEAEGVATSIIDRVGRSRLDEVRWRAGYLATAHYVRGQARRGEALRDSSSRAEQAALATADFRESARLWTANGGELGVANYDAAAFICRGGAASCEAMTGQRPVVDVVDELLAGLEAVVEVSAARPGWWPEAHGWWCVFGAELLLTRPQLSEEDHRRIAVFTNKGYELADACSHWTLRERILTIEHVRRTRDRGRHVAGAQTTLDTEDLRLLAGVMARFPAFRPLGWELVHSSRRI